MPKKRKPAETFDEHVGDAIERVMNDARLTQVELAALAGMPMTNLGRSIRGTRPLTVNEFERLAGVMHTPADVILESALIKFGGIEKLLAEEGPKSEAPDTVAPEDNVTYLGRVKAPLTAAADDDPALDQRTDVKELIAHAASLGVSVHVAHIDGPQRGYYDSAAKQVVYDYELTPVERDTVLAHELGHAFYDHQCYGNPAYEAAADYYAACLLIDPEAYIAAESLDPAPDAIAEQLGVEPKLVRAFEARALTRVRGITYVHSKMGAGQYRYAAAH